MINDTDAFINILHRIIVNKTDFIGASGHITFDENGDRIDGLYSFGNILEDGTVDFFGYFYMNLEGEVKHQFNISKIIWPDDFEEKGIKPQSGTLIIEEITTIDKAVSITMVSLLFLSIFVTLAFMIFILCFRGNIVIKAASYRLNSIMCIGAIMGYSAMILYGIDESIVSDIHTLDVLCNIRFWILIISYTVLFIPLFLKT